MQFHAISSAAAVLSSCAREGREGGRGEGRWECGVGGWVMDVRQADLLPRHAH